MLPKAAIAAVVALATGGPAVVVWQASSSPASTAQLEVQRANAERPVIRGPGKDLVKIRTCPQSYNSTARESAWRIDCSVHAEVKSGTELTMVCWVDEQAPWKGASAKWFQVRDVDGVANVDPPIRLWVWSDYVDRQTDGTPRCTDIGRENERAPEPEPLPEAKLVVTGSCTSQGGTLVAHSDDRLPFDPIDRELYSIGIWRSEPFEHVRDVGRGTLAARPGGGITFSWSCAGLAPGNYAVGVQVMTSAITWGDFTVGAPPKIEPPQPRAPSQPQPPAGTPPKPEQPRPPAPQQPAPQQPPRPTNPPKPTVSNFQVVVYNDEPGRVGVSYNVGWQAGRDPVTCHFFIDGREAFTAQCGTYSSKQFYGLAEGNHSFYATVSDKYGVYSDPSPTVTKYVPGRPAERALTIYNKVTNGGSEMREDTPAYLSTVTRNYCKSNGCAIGGTDMNTGATVTGLCWLWGDRTTNGEDSNARDDGNPGLYSSTRWYRARHPGGAVGYISEVWIDPSHRGGAGLPAC